MAYYIGLRLFSTKIMSFRLQHVALIRSNIPLSQCLAGKKWIAHRYDPWTQTLSVGCLLEAEYFSVTPLERGGMANSGNTCWQGLLTEWCSGVWINGCGDCWVSACCCHTRKISCRKGLQSLLWWNSHLSNEDISLMRTLSLVPLVLWRCYYNYLVYMCWLHAILHHFCQHMFFVTNFTCIYILWAPE